ncbi:hypothetical protein FHT86_005149 [Rhizobium sp. BK313]|nr:hypothetical protein [Rhizobium sp. BK313]
MKTIAALLFLSAIVTAGPALAISRYNTLGLSCASVQQIISRERAVLLRYPSRSGNAVLYDRYVAGGGQCGSGNYAATTSVPTRDNPMCPVYNCRSSSVFNPH